MLATTLNAIAQSSAERLVNSAVEGFALALFAWLALRLVPRQNAGTRFSIWMAALLSIAALPVAEALARVERPLLSALPYAALTLPAAAGTLLFLGWAAIALLLLARVALGLLQLRRLRNSAEEVELAALDALPRQTLVDFQQHRAVKLCISDSVSVPTAVGLFRPAVVVPRWALSELSADDLNSVLVHELAHLRRRDDWTNLLQKLVRAVFFFHPAVWWIENRLSLEREMACDEHVLATSTNPRAYAECLVSLAERGFLHRAVILAQGAVSRVRECSARVAQILSGSRPRTAGASRVAMLGAASGSVLLLATLAQAPNLVAFRSANTGMAQVASANILLAADSRSNGVVAPATWHSESQNSVRVAPAAYVPGPAAAEQVRRPVKATPKAISINTKPAVQPGLASLQSAPGLYHNVGLRQPNAVPGMVVLVQETAFFTNGSQVWEVSIYRMAVLRPQHATPNEFSRKAI